MHTLVHEQDIRDEGIAIGLEQGRNDKIAIVQRLLQKDYSINEIIDIVGCAQELIDEAKRKVEGMRWNLINWLKREEVSDVMQKEEILMQML